MQRALSLGPQRNNTWNDERRLLLFKVMALAAHADDKIVAAEDQLLEHKLADLRLPSEMHQEALDFLDEPEDINADLERLDSYQMRLNLYRHSTGVIHSDGTVTRKDHLFLDSLKQVLHIRPRDADTIANAFGKIEGAPCTRTILSLVAGGKKRKVNAPNPKEYDEIDQAREHIQLEERQRQEALAEALDAIDEVADYWAEFSSIFLSHAVIAPVDALIDEYVALEDYDIVELVAVLDSDRIYQAINENLSKVEQIGRLFYEDLQQGWAVGQDISELFDQVWHRVVNDDGGWESSVGDLAMAGAELIEKSPSVSGSVAKGSAVVGASVALGIIGAVGSVAASAYFGSKKKKEFDRASDRWDRAIQRFIDASQVWADRAQRHLERFFKEVIREAKKELESHGDPELAAHVVAQMYEDLDISEQEPDTQTREPIDYTVGVDSNCCPRCGRGYTADAVWCEICEVGL